MNKITISLLVFAGVFLSVSFASALTYVDGYYRQDGTYVRPYYRYNSDDLKIAEDNPRTIIIIQNNELQKQILEEQKKISEKLQRQLDDAAFQRQILQANNAIDFYLESGCLSPISPAIPYGCSDEQDYESAKSCINVRTNYISGVCQGVLDQCRKQIDDYQTKLGEYNKKKQEYEECVKKYQDRRIEEIANKIIELERLTAQNNLLEANNYCTDKYGSSYWDVGTKSCKCNKLRWMSGGKCELGLLLCTELLGPNIISSTDNSVDLSCNCPAGYELKEVEKNKFHCEKIVNETTAVNDADESEYEKLKSQYDQKYGGSKTKNELPNLTKLLEESKDTKITVATNQGGTDNDVTNDNPKEKESNKKPVSFFRKIADTISSFIMKIFGFKKN